MHRQVKLSAVIAWFLCAAACLAAIVSTTRVGIDAFSLVPVPFAITAAFIISRQPGNRIGWLLMIPVIDSIIAAPMDSYMHSLAQPPPTPGFPLLLMAWFINIDWLGLIFPLFLIPLLFPTGRLPSARWQWVLILAAFLCAILLFWGAFSKHLGPTDGSWTIANPIGILDDSSFQIFFIPWGIGLMVMTLSSVASIFVRFRRAVPIERQQIKWLLYACGLFAAIYIPGIWINGLSDASHSILNQLYNGLFVLTILAFPISIGIAILRYRLWDIDLIIRRTLQYGLLTTLLGLVYFGGVTLLQQVFTSITGAQSPLAVVLSTLLIVLLFTPVRRRVQAFIDRRFYRQKYDAEQAVAKFAATVRSETTLKAITDHMVKVVEETVQPDQVWVWMKDGGREPK